MSIISSNTNVVCVTTKQPETKIDFFSKIINFLQNSKSTVSIIKICGPIGNVGIGRHGVSLESLNDCIEQAFKPQKLVAVCLSINSPGGSPVQSELIASRIRMLANEKNVPVYTFIEDVGASGGYWVSCAGDYIYASKNSIVGSIGVISAGFGMQEAISKLGIQRRVYTSGKTKSILDPFMPERNEDIEIIKKLQRQIHDHFINYVKSRRHGRLTQNDEILFNGEFWTGASALDLGLIDGIDDLYSFIKTNFPDAKIKNTSPKDSWIKRKFGVSADLNNLGENFAEKLYTKISEKSTYSKFDFF